MTEILALVLMGAALGAAFVFHIKEASAWRVERADLLNRLMVKDWDQYRVMTKTEPSGDIIQLSTDQAEAQWYAARAREDAERESA